MNSVLTPIRVETGFWLILWLGLAAGIGLETDWGRQLRSPVTQIVETSPGFPKPVLAEPFHLADPDQYPEITARPIFLAARRPAPIAPPPEPPKPSMKKDQFILLGTTIVAEGKFAFLREKAGNKSRVVAEGKEINGIIVREITAERVVLSQYDDTEVLVLRMNKPPPGVPMGGSVAPAASASGVVPGAPAIPAGAPGTTPSPRRHAFPGSPKQ